MLGNAAVITHANVLCTPILPLPSLQLGIIPSTSTNLPTVPPLPGGVSLHRGRGQAVAHIGDGDNLPKSPISAGLFLWQ